MSIRSMLARMRAIDEAWNDRRWEDYAELIDDALVAYSSGSSAAHGKNEHIVRAKRFCEAFTDNLVHVNPYVALFASHDGKRTCSVARLTGTARGDLKLPSGGTVAPVCRTFDVLFTVICEWRSLRIVRQHQFFDIELMLRQLTGTADAPITPRRPE